MMTANTTPLRLAILLSGGGRTMVNIQQRIQAGTLSAQIAVVIASRPCKGLELARAAGLDVHLVSFKDNPQPQYSNTITSLLDAARVDIVVMAGFLSMWHIPPSYMGKVVNIHPALLPAFGGHRMYGHHVHEAVLRHGCKVSGCTVHYVTNEYDQGPIILQRCVPVMEDDTPVSLAARVFEQETEAFPEALQLIAEGRVKVEGHRARIR